MTLHIRGEPTLAELSIRLPDRVSKPYNDLRVRVRNDTHAINPPYHPDFIHALVAVAEAHYDELLTILKGVNP